MSKASRISTSLLGAAPATLASALVAALIAPLSEHGSPRGVLMLLLVYLVYFAIAEMVIGIPLFTAALVLRMTSWWAWLPLAVVAGLVLHLALGNPLSDTDALVVGTAVAVTSASSFRVAMAWPSRSDQKASAAS